MIPNILTTVRVGLVPLFAYFMLWADNLWAAALIFVLSGLTDVVDGYIARHYNMITNFGMIYDPFADKLMQITSVVCLVMRRLIPSWLLVLVLAKEASMIIIGGILYLRKIVVRSHWYGKAATVIFYTAVLFIIVCEVRNLPSVAVGVAVAVMITAMVCAAVGYLIDTIRNYDEKRV